MSAVKELASRMHALWDKEEKEIVEELSSEDYYNHNKDEFLDWYKQHGEHDLDEAATDEDYIREHIAERKDEFLSHFQYNAEDHGNKLIIYRCFSPKDEDEFLFHIAQGEPVEGYDGLGIFWSYDREKAGCHWGSGSSSQSSGDVVVEALVDVNEIDVGITLVLNLNPSTGAEEAEIRVKEGAKLEVLGVHTSDDQYISPLDEDLPPIPMTAIRAFEERPYPIAPEPDGNFDRENQLVELGMPEMNRIQMKEALMVRPSNLGRETRFMPDCAKYPAMHRMLRPELYKEPPKPEAPPLPPPPREGEVVKEELKFPTIESFLKEN